MKWLLVIGGIVAVVLLGAIVIAIVERHDESPIMRRRMNAGSSDYLADHGSLLDRILLYFGRTIDAIFGFLASIF